jgi:protein SCO1/2
MHGVVIGVDPHAGTAVIHHQPFGGMPSMTMTFAVANGKAATLRAGEKVSGDVDTSHDPWLLHVGWVGQPPPVVDTGAEPQVRVLQPGDAVPDANFIDQNGIARSWRDYRGQQVVVAFIYTRCRDATMCPLVSAKFEQMQPLLPAGAHLIEFTLDPVYDTPAVLRRYGAMFGQIPSRWTLATGDATTMATIAGEFGIGIASHTDTTIAHSESLGIVDASGRVSKIVFGNTWQPEEVVAAVRDASGLGSNAWDRFKLGLRYAARVCGEAGSHITGHAITLLVFLAIVVPIPAVLVIRDWQDRRRSG